MATFTPSRSPDPMVIDKFYGLNEAIAETEIKLGESVVQENFRITKDYKVEKRSGYQTFIDYSNELPTYFWHGILDSEEVIVSTNNSKLYQKILPDGTNTEIGAIAAGYNHFFQFGGILYIINGTQYKSFDGTTLADVTPYVPTIAIGALPTGGGTSFEEINLLTGLKWQEFIGDGTETEYQLAEDDIDATDVVVEIDGVTLIEGTEFTVDRTDGVVDFSAGTSPHGSPADESEVKIKWDKAVSEHADIIKKNKYSLIFGPDADTDVFLWGNSDNQNKFYRSAVADPTYFPVNNFNTVGTSDTAITDIKPHYDRIVIFKTDRTYYSFAETNPFYSENPALNPFYYVVRELNDKVGNLPYNGVQIIENYPVSFKSHSFWKWTSTNVEDERNAQNISSKISYSLDDISLSNAITFDYQKKKELWVNVGNNVYIWNYLIDAFYVYTNISATQFIDIDGIVYFSTNGTIEKMEGLNDNGVEISAGLELGFNDFGRNELIKNARKIWVSIKPQTKTSVKITYATNNKLVTEAKEVILGYSLFDYGYIDYGSWSYLTNRNPQTLVEKIRARKFTSIKLIFTNEELDETLIILSVKLPAEIISEVR